MRILSTFLILLLGFRRSLAQLTTTTSSVNQGWLQNVTYSNLDCTGAVTLLTLQTMGVCVSSTPTTGEKPFCIAASAGVNSSWSLYVTQFSNPNCSVDTQATIFTSKVSSGKLCDNNGNRVSCVTNLSTAPFTTAPLSLTESAYVSPACEEQSLYQRIITPTGGCSRIEVNQYSSTPDGDSVMVIPETQYIKLQTCEFVNNGYVAFGTLHADPRCLNGPGTTISHVLPKGCLAAGPYTISFACG